MRDTPVLTEANHCLADAKNDEEIFPNAYYCVINYQDDFSLTSTSYGSGQRRNTRLAGPGEQPLDQPYCNVWAEKLWSYEKLQFGRHLLEVSLSQ